MHSIANVVSLSGGKDSTALALLAIERQTPNLHFVFADTGHEHPLTYDYVHYLDGVLKERCGVGIRWVRADFSKDIERRRRMMQAVIDGTHKDQGRYKWTPAVAAKALEVLSPTGIPFLDMCMVHGRFPSTRVRFCTKELKHFPIMMQVHLPLSDEHDAVVSWQGVRKQESLARATLEERDVEMGSWDPEPSGLLIYRPILDWTVEEVFGLHRKHGVKSNPLYERGMGRVGCMPCIHARKDELLEISKRFPEVIARVAEWEAIVGQVSKTSAATFFAASELGAETAADVDPEKHGIYAKVEWAKTSRGGRQFDLIKAIEAEDVALCSSIYGLCE